LWFTIYAVLLGCARPPVCQTAGHGIASFKDSQQLAVQSAGYSFAHAMLWPRLHALRCCCPLLLLLLPAPLAGSYTTDRLRELFGSKFLVEDVILKDSRKKKKASALVVLDSVAAAGQAAHEVLGDLKNPLLVTPYFKVMPEAGQGQQQQMQPAAGAQGSGAGSAGAGSPAADGSRQRPVGTPLFPGAGAAGGGGGGGGKPVQRPSKPLFPSE
jgi:hypothetical protein